MGQCPTCQSHVPAESTECPNCGLALQRGRDDRPTRPRESGRGPAPEGGAGYGARQGDQQRRPRDEDPQRPRDEGHEQGHARQARQGRGPRGEPARPQSGEHPATGADSGYTRRELAAYGGGLLALGGGGFLVYRQFLTGGGYGSGPVGTVREFLDALERRDAGAAQSLVHSESSLDISFDAPDSEGASLAVDDVRRGDSGVDRERAAFVEADVTITRQDDATELTYTFELRREDGSWRILALDVEPRGSPGTDSPPRVSFTFEYDASGGTGTLTVTHDGGTDVQARTLFVRGSDGGTNNLGGSWERYDPGVDGVDDVQAGMSIAVAAVDSDAVVRIVWESPDDDRSATLDEWVGPDA